MGSGGRVGLGLWRHALALAIITAASASSLTATTSDASTGYCNELDTVSNSSLPGGFANCFVATSLHPRQCTCISNTCEGGDDPAACTICNRGGYELLEGVLSIAVRSPMPPIPAMHSVIFGGAQGVGSGACQGCTFCPAELPRFP